MNRWQEFISEKRMPLNFVWFYMVGLVLFILPLTRELFTAITAFTLLLVITIVFCFQKEWNSKILTWFTFIIASSFLLEMVGVSTGKLFGTYQYYNSLGLKLFETPLIIGLNWLFLVYASHDIAGRITKRSLLRILLGAGLMLLYDLVLELVAPVMQMWHFDSFYPPVANFVTWFLAAAIFHTGFVWTKIKINNRPARMLFWIQMGFFALISLYRLIFLI